MCFTGTAFLGDHLLLVHQRNALRAAVDAASVAAGRQIVRLDSDLTDEETLAALTSTARRYTLANLAERYRESAQDTLELTVTPDRENGTVGIKALADLGGAVVGKHIWGRLVGKTRATAGAEIVLVPVDVVLAIDVTKSMGGSIRYGESWGSVPLERRRINVVRKAAQILVRGLYAQDGGDIGHVSVGLVPFNTTVNIGAARRSWVTDIGQGHKLIPAGFGAWRGCIEHRLKRDDLDLSLVTPDVAPFTSWFAPSTLNYRPAERASLQQVMRTVNKHHKVRGENDWSADEAHEEYRPSPQYGCPRDVIVPPTTDISVIEQAIGKLQPWHGGGTMGHLGVVWGRRLLASEWRTHWGLPEHTEDELVRKKVLVLLSDGANSAYADPTSYPGNYKWAPPSQWNPAYTSEYTGYGRAGNGTIEEGHRAGDRLDGLTSSAQARTVLNQIMLRSCQAAKDEGITVFTVSATPRGHPKEQALRQLLTDCATATGYAFVEHNDPELMQTAFREIGRKVGTVRRKEL